MMLWRDRLILWTSAGEYVLTSRTHVHEFTAPDHEQIHPGVAGLVLREICNFSIDGVERVCAFCEEAVDGSLTSSPMDAQCVSTAFERYVRELRDRTGRLALFRKRSTFTVGLALPQTEPPPEPKAAATAAKPRTTFTVKLVTEDGYPIPAADFDAEFSGGERRSGKLSLDGTAKLEDVPEGPVYVWYPDQADVSAKALAVAVRRGLDRQDYTPLYTLLRRSPTAVQTTITAYDRHFNDYTGKGFLEDLDTVFTDNDAHRVIGSLLARANITFGEPVELLDWRQQDGG